MPDSRLRYRLAAAFLILGAALLRLVYLANDCPLDLAPDEAHYWDWSRHLDWSYYSKGPLVAWIIRLSCWLFGPLSEHLTGSEMLAWGGIVIGPNPIFDDGGRYNPVSDSWSPMTQVNAPHRRMFCRPDLGIWRTYIDSIFAAGTR